MRFDEHHDDLQKIWLGSHYGIVLQRPSKLAQVYVIGIISKTGPDEFVTMHPRFEAHTSYHADLIVSALVRGLRAMRDDMPQSKVQEFLDHVSKQFGKIYNAAANTRMQILLSGGLEGKN